MAKTRQELLDAIADARAARWMVSDDTGLSSVDLCAALLGGAKSQWGPPADCWDFGRCYRLLKLIPEWRRKLVSVRRPLGPQWRPFLDAWDELERLWEAAGCTWSDEMYAVMKKLEAE